MTALPTQHQLHRTAKYFMDNGRAPTHEAAMAMLASFGLNIYVGHELEQSVDHQSALLTLVNVARRTLLGGIRVIGLGEWKCISPLAPKRPIRQAVEELGGVVSDSQNPSWPGAIIGTVTAETSKTTWRLTWNGWRGGVVPGATKDRLPESDSISLTPALAAAACAAEAFAYFAADHTMAGRRALGLSLWQPSQNWLSEDSSEPALKYLPSRLWLIGLGNLGQAFAWLLGGLPRYGAKPIELVLQDFDNVAESNDSTSLLSHRRDVGQKKTRMVAQWLEDRGFQTVLEERRFGEATRRAEDEPAVALCGVDNANTRLLLDKAGFELVVEAGLGAGPQAFRSIAMHTFPATRTPADIWSLYVGVKNTDTQNMPAYQELKQAGMDECGLTLLASRSVGVPFVGLMAGCLVLSELLRRLHNGKAFEVLATSASSLEDVATSESEQSLYGYGHLTI